MIEIDGKAPRVAEGAHSEGECPMCELLGPSATHAVGDAPTTATARMLHDNTDISDWLDPIKFQSMLVGTHQRHFSLAELAAHWANECDPGVVFVDMESSTRELCDRLASHGVPVVLDDSELLRTADYGAIEARAVEHMLAQQEKTVTNMIVDHELLNMLPGDAAVSLNIQRRNNVVSKEVVLNSLPADIDVAATSEADLAREPRSAPNSLLQGAMGAGGLGMLAAMATLGGMYGSPPPRRWDPIGSSRGKTPVTESPARAAKRAARRAQGKARARNKR